MKVRTVEYQPDIHNPQLKAAIKEGSPVELAEFDSPLDYDDPGVTNDWEDLAGVNPPTRVRSRMFFDVESVIQTSAKCGPDTLVPGAVHKLRFNDGKTITVHNAVIAEMQEESGMEPQRRTA